MIATTLAVQYVAAPRSFSLPTLMVPRRRRAFLNSSCAVNALLVMPAALSVGVLLAGPVQAATTLAGTNSGIALATYGTIDNPFTITGGTTISGAENGIFGSDAGAWTVSNAGMVKTTGSSNVAGVLFSGGGTLTNTGTILDTMPIVSNFGVSIGGGAASVDNAGQITGFVGVGVSDGGRIDNSGLIAGNGTGVILTGGIGSVTNLGSITGQEVGVSLGSGGGYLYNGFTVVNSSVTTAGYISGGVNGVLATGTNATVINAGTIFGDNVVTIEAYGVLLTAGGTVRNDATGTIFGENEAIGIEGGAGTVLNSGIIEALSGNTYSAFGVALQDGGYVSNSSGGTIFGAEAGIGAGAISAAVATTIVNDGSVGGSFGLLLFGPGNITNNGYIGATIAGVIAGYTLGSESLTNGVSGVIEGTLAGVALGGDSDTLFNAGTIIGGGLFATLGAVALAGGTVTNSDTGLIDSTYIGIASLYTNASAVTVLNSGTIEGGHYGISLKYAGGYVSNASGGTISSAGAGIYDRYGAALSITNAAGGTISGGTYGINVFDIGQIAISNAGEISGGGQGVAILTGNLTNEAGGLITGSIGVELADGVLLNAGTIIGTLGSGVVGQFPSITNQSGGTISGASDGIILQSRQPGTISNNGLITGALDEGINLQAGGLLLNGAAGTISGGHDGIFAGVVYYDIRYGPLTLSNAGTISGTHLGVDLVAGGTITNAAGGLIAGGYGGVLIGDSGTLINQARATISGGSYGVDAYNAVIRNAGLITDTPLLLHAGVAMNYGVTLTNLSTGTIRGETGILVGGAGDTIFNAGTIIATNRRDAIELTPAAEDTHITLSTGSSLTGDILGGGTDSQIYLTGEDSMNSAIRGFGNGALTVAPGADWTASGFWTIASVVNDGRFQPGIPGFALNLTGNFVQASTGTLQVVVTPEATSQFIVTGTAQLAGELSYEFAPGVYSPHDYEFLSASGGVTGAFSKVSSNAPAGVTASTYGVADAADLVLAGNSVPPSGGGGGGGGKKAPGPPGSRPLVIVSPLDDSIYADADQAAAMDSVAADDVLVGQAVQPGGGNAAACASAAGPMAAARGAGDGGQIANAMAAAFCDAGGWVEASGGVASVTVNGDAAGYGADSGGFLAGIGRQVNQGGTRIGLAVGYDQTDVHDAAGGKAGIDTTRVGLYGAQPVGVFTLAGDFMLGFANNTVTRPTGVGAARSSYGGTDYTGALQIGTAGMLDGVLVQPAIGLRVASVAADGFAESGGGFVPAFAVRGAASSYDSVQPYVKLGLSHGFLTASGVTVTPEVSVGYSYQLGDVGRAVDVTAADGTHFRSGVAELGIDTVELSGGIAASRGNWSVYARYRGYITLDSNDEIGEVGAAVRF